ncbi:MAG: hypothetical protein HY587_09015 [Candidatus Omnitrophica bacterium]|nr:hypothetical protein [Candidatus Omnitrophota bacterium]
MAKVFFDDAFIEGSVFAYLNDVGKCCEQASLTHFYGERDRLYEISSLEEREAAFRTFYERAFVDTGLRRIFDEVISEFPFLNQLQVTIIVKPAHTRKDEEAELFHDDSQLTVLIAIQPFRVMDRDYLQAFLRHELMHVSDMLDPDFHYDPAVKLPALNDPDENLIRERFRVLWALYVDARINRKGCRPFWPMEKYKRDLEITFRFWTQEERNVVAERLLSTDRLTQADLIHWATDTRLTKTIGEGGLICPICRLPTHAGITESITRHTEIIQAIRSDRTDWDVSMGICPQCFDLYASKVKVMS